MVEAWRRSTPWLFGDELEFTQLSRSIAATGHAAERGHVPLAGLLYTYLIAPLWRIHDVATAYSAIKYFDVLVMAAVVFPTYLLARMSSARRRRSSPPRAPARSRRWPTRRTSSRSRSRTHTRRSASTSSPRRSSHADAQVDRGRHRGLGRRPCRPRRARRSIPAALVLAAIFAAWSSEAARRWRAGWSTGDWIGAVVLAPRRDLRPQRHRQRSLGRDPARHARVQAPGDRRGGLGRGHARHRHGRAPVYRRARGALPRSGRAGKPRGADVPLRLARRHRRVRLVHRDQGRVSVHGRSRPASRNATSSTSRRSCSSARRSSSPAVG